MCIGTSPENCDILERTNCLLRSNIIKTGLSLPLHTPVFATVTAFNKLSLNVTKSSDSFFVDETPPLVLTRPFFIVEENNNPWKIGQWDRSVLHIQWEFIDEESPIVRHYVSLATHHEGHTPVENIQLGAENNFKISLDGRSWLHNGDTYFVTVTGCNMAGLCISESTNDLIVDSTAPHLGGFKLPMYWENFNGSVTAWKSNITLSWYGFHDQESEIERYFITISKTYSGNEITNGVTTVNVNVSDSKTEHSYTFLTTDHLERDDKLYLTIWAENSVGLKSSLARASVFVLSSSSTADVTNQRGTLELEKHSCDIHYCNKDCTCAIIGKPCVEVQSNSTCEEIGNPLEDEDVPAIQVFNGLNEKSTNITASSACLSGSWKVIDGKRNTTSILRFEWSMGLQYHHFGEGIFDLKNEIPWNDVGLQSQVVHCLPVNRSLIAREKYVIYVRAWLTSDNYATFHSAPILVDHSPPSLVRGRTVLDSNELCNVDFDIIDWMDTITVCWHGVFSEQQGTIVNYFLAMGTYPSGDDTIQRQDVGLNSSFTFSNLSVTHGTKYFFTITSYNNVDLHSLAVSDGFIVDIDDPISGVVYNTPSHRNAPYQSSTSTIGLSWHGFQDKVSGLRNYYVAVSDTPTIKADINFTNTGLSTRHVFRNLELKHGHKYYGFVKSLDNVGHQSIVAVSNGIKIDNTPPTAYICQTYVAFKHVSEVVDAIDNKSELNFQCFLEHII
ncbi:uncharacterized protein LOC132726438 [Ruditapes philippinarum]|uniref:uncharacterized protein LOC132726438 n=1 Tax=Ruditapes philippinarum TaxID=129788 RepID=UPI00295ACDE7|nr:uncharacterized protein LOC132726438 [Ruditapes philippinarum]